MNVQNTMKTAGCAIALGTMMALVGAHAAGATEHDATTTDGVADVRITFGEEFAGATATVLVLEADADPDAPTQDDIAYVTEVTADAEGTAAFRAALPAGLDYWLASAPEDGERYVAMLDGSEGSDGDSDDGDSDDGDSDDGGSDDGGSDDGGTDDGGSDGGPGGDTGSDGDGADVGSDGETTGADGDLATTGQPDWLLPVGVLLAGALVASGAVLHRRRRAD